MKQYLIKKLLNLGIFLNSYFLWCRVVIFFLHGETCRLHISFLKQWQKKKKIFIFGLLLKNSSPYSDVIILSIVIKIELVQYPNILKQYLIGKILIFGLLINSYPLVLCGDSFPCYNGGTCEVQQAADGESGCACTASWSGVFCTVPGTFAVKSRTIHLHFPYS